MNNLVQHRPDEGEADESYFGGVRNATVAWPRQVTSCGWLVTTRREGMYFDDSEVQGENVAADHA